MRLYAVNWVIGTDEAGMSELSVDTSEEVATLYRRYRAAISRYVARRFGAGPPDPDDVVQAVFEKYAAALAAQKVHNPRAFLFRSAHNYIIDERRKQLVRFDYAREVQEIGDRCDDLDASRVLDAKQSWAAIEQAIAQLDARAREFLLMNRIHGLSSAEIARRNGCSPTLVKSIIGRALVECRHAIAERE